MQDLKEILKELVKLRAECDLPEATDSILFDTGVRIFNSQNINQHTSGDKHVEHKPIDELATSKQLFFLEKNGYKIPKDMTKLEASEAISEIKSRL